MNIRYGFFKTFFNALDQYEEFNQEIKDFILPLLEKHHYKKGELILNIGETSEKIYFVNTGILRGLMYFNDKEITTWLAGQDSFASSISSFFGTKPSKECIQVLENAYLVSISKSNIELVFKKYPRTLLIYVKIIENYYYLANERVFLTKLPTSKDRYEYFLSSSLSHQVSNISYKYLAEYLGITPETLSRLLKSRNS
jgi:CRP/FNR family transcriptional regulator, anaerobic regulatory protein